MCISCIFLTICHHHQALTKCQCQNDTSCQPDLKLMVFFFHILAWNEKCSVFWIISLSSLIKYPNHEATIKQVLWNNSNVLLLLLSCWMDERVFTQSMCLIDLGTNTTKEVICTYGTRWNHHPTSAPVYPVRQLQWGITRDSLISSPGDH